MRWSIIKNLKYLNKTISARVILSPKIYFLPWFNSFSNINKYCFNFLLSKSANSLLNSFQQNIGYIISWRHFWISHVPKSIHWLTFALSNIFVPSNSGLNLVAKNVSILIDSEILPCSVSRKGKVVVGVFWAYVFLLATSSKSASSKSIFALIR